MSGVGAISRRYFVMNSFDGALTALGIVMGAATSRVVNPRLVLGTGLGASLAMAVSGFSGAYMTEKAERERSLRRLRRAMLHSLDRSIHVKAMKAAVFWAALVDALSPAFAAFLSMIPFFLAAYSILDTRTAVFSSVTIILLTLLFLGIYLGRISRGNVLLSGMRTLALGIITALIALVLELL